MKNESAVVSSNEMSIDLSVVSRMALLGISQDLMAGYWGMTKDEFKDVIAKNPDLQEACLTN